MRGLQDQVDHAFEQSGIGQPLVARHRAKGRLCCSRHSTMDERFRRHAHHRDTTAAARLSCISLKIRRNSIVEVLPTTTHHHPRRLASRCYGLAADGSHPELRLQTLVELYDARVRCVEGEAIWIRENQ